MKSQLDFELFRKLDEEGLRTNPNLDIGARFWDEERYQAFKILYRPMRIIDDLVDNYKSDGKGRDNALNEVDHLIKGLEEKLPDDLVREELLETLSDFQMPMEPWVQFIESMAYDMNNEGFKTFFEFLEYSEGGAIAPGSIYMHMCGIKKENGNYVAPSFDTRKAAKHTALFFYLVHIIRDFEEDQKNNLNYFAEDRMAENGLSKEDLKEIAKGGEVTPEFRNLINQYCEIAEGYRLKAYEEMEEIRHHLEPRYQLSLKSRI